MTTPITASHCEASSLDPEEGGRAVSRGPVLVAAPDLRAEAAPSGDPVPHIVIIDDEPEVARELAEYLARRGFPSRHTSNPREGFRLVLHNPEISVVITDVRMPGLNGFDMARELKKALPASRTVELVVMTGHAGFDEAVEALQAGASDFLTKPISPKALLHAVRRSDEIVRLRRLDLDYKDKLKHALASAETELRETELRLTSIADNLPGVIFQGLIRSDGSRAYTYLGGASDEFYGYRISDLVSDPKGLLSVVHPDDIWGLVSAERVALEDLTTWESDFRIVLPDGANQWLHSIAQPRRLENGDVICEGIILDINDQKYAEQKLESLAFYDPVTGLPNRNNLLTTLEKSIVEAKKTGLTVSVVQLDIERLNIVNETYGYETGNELLCSVGTRLRELGDPEMVIGRSGDSALVCLLTGLSNSGSIARKIEDIEELISTPFRIDGQELFVNFSLGISSYPDDGSDPETIFKNADAALQRSKRSSPRRPVFYDRKMSERIRRRVSMEAQLRRALDRDEIIPFFQPQESIKDKQIVGVEALARWFRADGTSMPPSEFISVAEDSGLIEQIGDVMMHTAIGQTANQRLGRLPFTVSVNISGEQLKRPGLARRISAIMNESKIEPSLLKLELTESVLLDDVETARRFMAEMDEMGVGLEIDDFGTGYSSLSYLTEFPVERLKIDRKFVTNMVNNDRHAKIVQAIITMAHALGLKVVAEGVETEEELVFLRAYQCDYMQGYLLSRPMSGQDLFSWLSARR